MIILTNSLEIHISEIRGSVLKFLESGNENTATFGADDFRQNSNIYVIVYFRTSKAVKFYLLRSPKNHKYKVITELQPE